MCFIYSHNLIFSMSFHQFVGLMTFVYVGFIYSFVRPPVSRSLYSFCCFILSPTNARSHKYKHAHSHNFPLSFENFQLFNAAYARVHTQLATTNVQQLLQICLLISIFLYHWSQNAVCCRTFFSLHTVEVELSVCMRRGAGKRHIMRFFYFCYKFFQPLNEITSEISTVICTIRREQLFALLFGSPLCYIRYSCTASSANTATIAVIVSSYKFTIRFTAPVGSNETKTRILESYILKKLNE